MRIIQFLSLCAFVFSVALGGVSAETKKFTPEQIKLPGKKGACFTLREKGSKQGGTVEENMPRVKALNPSWNYSWGTTLANEQPQLVEFIPMIWSASNVESLQEKLNEDVIPNIKTGRIERLLAFNEPDHTDQANMTYIKALELWPTLVKLGIPLCSPACANAEGVNDDTVQGVDGTWMRDFMKEAGKRGYRVDYIGVHSYGGTDPKSFKTKLKRIYERYGKRPLLITEFAVADWNTGGDIKKNKHTPEAVLAFMKDVVPWMEKQDWIIGYSWFYFNIDSPQGTSSALFDLEGNLTNCGKFYRSVTPQNPKGDQSITIEKTK